MSVLDPFTFGNTPAAVNLADILSKEDGKTRRKVASKVHHYFELFKSALEISDPRQQKEIVALIYQKCKFVIAKLDTQAKVKSHAINVLQTRYKIIIRGEV
jgi:hypothetical protein